MSKVEQTKHPEEGGSYFVGKDGVRKQIEAPNPNTPGQGARDADGNPAVPPPAHPDVEADAAAAAAKPAKATSAAPAAGASSTDKKGG